MQDMLVRLYDLPSIHELEQDLLEKENIIFRNAIAPEKHLLVAWAKESFSEFWASEVEVAFARQPVTCIVAHQGNKILGFACYETTARSFFGPTGVLEEQRGKKIGKVLLIKALEGLKNLGYAYGIIGGVGPHEYYQKTVGAELIPGSENSIYKHLLRIEGLKG
jgi:GNAT superfamily N-acetyltransferase